MCRLASPRKSVFYGHVVARNSRSPRTISRNLLFLSSRPRVQFTALSTFPYLNNFYLPPLNYPYKLFKIEPYVNAYDILDASFIIRKSIFIVEMYLLFKYSSNDATFIYFCIYHSITIFYCCITLCIGV